MWGEALSSNQPKPGNDYVDINAGWLCRSWLTFLLTNKRSREAQGTGKENVVGKYAVGHAVLG